MNASVMVKAPCLEGDEDRLSVPTPAVILVLQSDLNNPSLEKCESGISSPCENVTRIQLEGLSGPCGKAIGAEKVEHFSPRQTFNCHITTPYKYNWGTGGRMGQSLIKATNIQRIFHVSYSSSIIIKCLVIGISGCCHSRFGYRI